MTLTLAARLVAISTIASGLTAGTAEAIREGRLGGLSTAHACVLAGYFSTGEAGDGGGALTSPAPSLSILSFILNVEPART